MQYELSEQEIQHIEKYRLLTEIGQGAIDMFMERLIPIDDEMNREYYDKKKAQK